MTKIIATHNGAFHADDVFGVAVLAMLHPDHEITRTREPGVIEVADFVVDVGGIWDAPTGRFDHHQKDFSGARASGVIYASAGLVWREYGDHLVMEVAKGTMPEIKPSQAEAIAAAIDADLVQYLDMVDTGASHCAPGNYGLASLVSQFNAQWLDRAHPDENFDRAQVAAANERVQLDRFGEAVQFMTVVIINAIKEKISNLAACDMVRAATLLENGQILLLEEGGMPWQDIVQTEKPDVLFVIYPDSTDKQYQIKAVTVAPDSFVARRNLPASWAGLRDQELAEVTGVEDAVFCHNKLFIAGAKSKAGILELAKQAIRT